jgi:uncharacterized membrane protein YcaP (DUF421 family)
MDDPIVAFDFGRMVLGDTPLLFLAEIFLRTVFIYGYALLLLRWVGGRSVAQLSVVEFLLVIALGSAVGDTTFYPDVPILHAMVVITTVVVFDKAMDILIRRYRRAKQLIDGGPVRVMQDGRILKDGTLDRQLGDLELMEMLREAGIENLGQVRVAYVEAGGRLSVFRADPPRRGLRIVPPVELEPYAPVGAGQAACCIGCGAVQRAEDEGCAHCPERGLTWASLPFGTPPQ